MTTYQLIKISLIILMVIFCILENKRLKKYDKADVYMGTILIFSIFSIDNIPKLCIIINISLWLIWIMILKFDIIIEKIKFLSKIKLISFINKHSKNRFCYYILPCFIFLIGYSIGLLSKYWVASLLVLLQVYIAFLSLCFASMLVYLLTYIKYPIIALFKRKRVKAVYNDEKYQKQTNFIFYLILPYLALMAI